MAKSKKLDNQPSLFDYYEIYEGAKNEYGNFLEYGKSNATQLEEVTRQGKESIQSNGSGNAAHINIGEQDSLVAYSNTREMGLRVSKDNKNFGSTGINNASNSPISNGNGISERSREIREFKSIRNTSRTGSEFDLLSPKFSNIQQPEIQRESTKRNRNKEDKRNGIKYEQRSLFDEYEINGIRGLGENNNAKSQDTISRDGKILHTRRQDERNNEEIRELPHNVDGGQSGFENIARNRTRLGETIQDSIRNNEESHSFVLNTKIPSFIPEEDDRNVKSQNNTNFKTESEVYIGNLYDRFNKNIKAIKLLQELETQNVLPNLEQQHILNSYSGWGGIPQAFDMKNERWQDKAQILKELLNQKEYSQARRSTLDAFYTPKIIVDSIYKGLEHFGFNNDNNEKDIFEPSVGIGTFLSYANRDNYNFTATELDGISARIANKLYPNATIHNIGFEQYCFSRKYDAFIGNPPFGQKTIIDEDSDLDGLSVHNYFIANSIKNLKDDGIGAFVVSSYFLDSKDSSTREKIAKEATFLGAIRLPNSIFKQRANTEVMTDIVFFKKGIDEKINNTEWINTQVIQDNINCNKYFLANRQQIIGRMEITTSQYGLSLSCKVYAYTDIAKDIEKAINNLPKDVYKYHDTIYQHKFFQLNPDSPTFEIDSRNLHKKKEGNLVFIDNEVFSAVYSSIHYGGMKLKLVELNKRDKERAKGFISLRDEFNSLIELEQSNIEDSNDKLIIQRQKLNKSYDDFIKKFGYLNSLGNKAIIKRDVEANKIMALEKSYTKAINKITAQKLGIEPKEESASKADIFYRRTIKPAAKLRIETPKEALLASLSFYGGINLDFIQESLQIPLEEALNDLKSKKLIFINHRNKKEYILAENYLSGNVKKRYKEVKSLVDNGDDSLRINMESLEVILPKDLKATDISVNLGTTWIPQKYYEKFASEIFGCEVKDVNIKFSHLSGWNVALNNISQEALSKYSYWDNDHRINPEKIFKYAISRNAMIITKIVGYDEKEKPIKETDYEATAIVNEKIESLQALFNDWIYSDYERRSDLENIYNETFNTNVPKIYDGSHLELIGFNKNKKLYTHQKNAIWRAIQEKSLLLDHQVGAGKTLTTICAIMEQKRIGLIKKPLVIVPNHILKQWQLEFYSAYPDANILIAEKSEFEKNKREQFFAKIASNNWDCVIMTHSQFNDLPVPYDYLSNFIYEQILEYEETIETMKSDDLTDSRAIKRMEKKKDDMENKLRKINIDKTKSIDFSELGIDGLIVDEAHEFKNLGITTSMQNILGLGSSTPAQKAQSLFVVTQYMHDNNHKITFLTGTPISNTIVELYTMQRYLQPQILKEKNIHSFDAWASTFGESVTDFELDSSGINYKLATRFSKFKNVGELMELYRNNADIITNDDILKVNPLFVPKLYNDKPINIICPRSEEIANFIGVQDENMQWNEGSIVWRMENFKEDPIHNNILACTTDARKAGLDFRLINPNAKDYEESKVNALVKNIFAEWQEWSEQKGTQLVFCDLSTPKTHSQKVKNANDNIKIQEEPQNINEVLENSENIELQESKGLDELIALNSKFDIYSDVLKKLVKMGIPQNEIAFIHDAKTEIQKQKLFDDVNAGNIRILIGSRSKMGAGTNVQERITSVHHLDCPWRPSDLLQSNGRAIRQGNKLFAQYGDNFRIKEFRYATERTYDARQWQVIETKSKSIEQFRNADSNTRELEDISMGSADAAEMKAQATGNPLILMQIQLAKELKIETIKESAFKKELFMNEETIKKNIDIKPLLEEEISTLKDIIKILQNNPKSQNFTCEAYNGEIFEKFEINKDDNNTQKKLEEIFWKNFHNAIDSNQETYFFKYRGLTITGLANQNNQSFNFIINNKDKFIEPENLQYKSYKNNQNELENIINFSGLWARINNFCNIDRLYLIIEEKESNIKKSENIVSTLSKKIINKEYPRNEYLTALRNDNKQIINEIRKMSSKKGYISTFKPKSQIILSKLEEKKKNDLNIGGI